MERWRRVDHSEESVFLHDVASFNVDAVERDGCDGESPCSVPRASSFDATPVTNIGSSRSFR
jgi:hypothetical protein